MTRANVHTKRPCPTTRRRLSISDEQKKEKKKKIGDASHSYPMKIIKKRAKSKNRIFFSIAFPRTYVLHNLARLLARWESVLVSKADHNSQRAERCSAKSWTESQSPNNQYGERIRRLRKRDHVFNSTKSREMRWWGDAGERPRSAQRSADHGISTTPLRIHPRIFFFEIWHGVSNFNHVKSVLFFFFLLLALSRDTLWTDKNIRQIFSPFGY